MKKILTLMAAGAVAASMTACGSSNTAGTTAAVEAADTTAADTTAAGSTAAEAETEAAEVNEDLTGMITAAGSSALKPLVDDAADMFAEKYPNVAITIDAGGSGAGGRAGRPSGVRCDHGSYRKK